MIDTKEKLAGLLVPVFALRTPDDLGIGDTESVRDAIDFCARTGLTVLQVLPINETGGDNSPYNAISSVALDPVLLSMTPKAVPGLTEADIAELAPTEQVEALRKGSVQYPAVKSLKLKLLRRAFENVETKKGAELEAFSAFQNAEKEWLAPYSLFRTIVHNFNGDACWTRWPEEVRTLSEAEKWIGNSPERQQDRRFFSFVQMVAFTQWRAIRSYADSRGVRLMGDIPFGVSRFSADVWDKQHLFDLEWSGGAPPETWFQDNPFVVQWGQNWGLPLYRWDEHEKENFAWWRQRVQKSVEIFNYFRIDHVLGFFRIYAFPWLPEDNDKYIDVPSDEAKKMTGGRLPGFNPRPDDTEEDAELNAKEGEYLLTKILEAAGSSGVVAEDLGLVPPYVRPILQKLGIPGFTIPIWERQGDRELTPRSKHPELSLVTYATHDHEPMASYYDNLVKAWHGPNGHEPWLELQRLMRFLELDDEKPPEEFTAALHAAMMEAILESRSWLAVFMVTDLLGTSERFNMPGLASDSNWSQRLSDRLSHYEKHEPFSARIQELRRLIKETNRLPKALQVGTIS